MIKTTTISPRDAHRKVPYRNDSSRVAGGQLPRREFRSLLSYTCRLMGIATKGQTLNLSVASSQGIWAGAFPFRQGPQSDPPLRIAACQNTALICIDGRED